MHNQPGPPTVAFWNGNHRYVMQAKSVRYDASGAAFFTVNVGGRAVEVASTGCEVVPS